MKAPENPQDQIQRTGSPKRKLPLLLGLAIALLAVSSAQATIMIDASEVGSDVVFTLSGNVNLASLVYQTSGLVGIGGFVIPSSGYVRFNNGTVDSYSLPGLAGPLNFGTGNLTSASGSGDFFAFDRFGSLALSGGADGQGLSSTMDFTGASFSTLGDDARNL